LKRAGIYAKSFAFITLSAFREVYLISPTSQGCFMKDMEKVNLMVGGTVDTISHDMLRLY